MPELTNKQKNLNDLRMYLESWAEGCRTDSETEAAVLTCSDHIIQGMSYDNAHLADERMNIELVLGTLRRLGWTQDADALESKFYEKP